MVKDKENLIYLYFGACILQTTFESLLLHNTVHTFQLHKNDYNHTLLRFNPNVKAKHFFSPKMDGIVLWKGHVTEEACFSMIDHYIWFLWLFFCQVING